MHSDDEQIKLASTEISDSVDDIIVVHDDDKTNNRISRDDGVVRKRHPASVLRDPFLGTTINQLYEINSLIGKGATSAVYKALDLTTNGVVAIKILHSHLVEISTIVARFEQEATTSRLLRHPNIVAIHEVDTTESGIPFLVMEFVEGISLQDKLKTTDWLPTQLAIPIFLQVCAALSVAHEKGVIHRDLKPSNIMLTESEDGNIFVKVLDFGIAKILPGQGDTVMKLTQTGETLGSLLYMSPEQCLDQDLDGRSDCYSLGCVMYETMTGKPPLCARTAFETMNKHLTELPERFDKVRPDITWPRGLQELVFRALAKAPSQRYQRIGQLQDDLQALQYGKPNSPLEPLLSSQSANSNNRIESQVSRILGITRDGKTEVTSNGYSITDQHMRPQLSAQSINTYAAKLTLKSILFSAPICLVIVVTLFAYHASIPLSLIALYPALLAFYPALLALFVIGKLSMWTGDLPFRPNLEHSPQSGVIAGRWEGQFDYDYNSYDSYGYNMKQRIRGGETFDAFFSFSEGAITGSIEDAFGESKLTGMVDYPTIRFKKRYRTGVFHYYGTFLADGTIEGIWQQAGVETWSGTWVMKPVDLPKITELSE